jgi:hypothetical protein
MRKYNIYVKKKGFTFIEAITVLFIASVVVVTFLNVFSQGSVLLLESKRKTIALSLANEVMEQVRNLQYDSIGISGGIPNGSLNGEAFLTRDGIEYRVITDVRYIDDDFDGVAGGTPDDTINTDHKLVTIRVVWGEEDAYQETSLSSIFVPPGVETNLGAGTLSLNVINGAGESIPSVNVNLVNTIEGIDISTSTDNTGNLFLPGAPVSQKGYEIALSKNGYESVVTYSPYPTSAYTPVDEHASVVEGGVSTKVIVMDELSNLTLRTRTGQGDVVEDAKMNLFGGRLLGTYTDDSKEYIYDEYIQTDSSGEIRLENISTGDYWVNLQEETAENYTLVYVNPGSDQESGKFSLNPGVDDTIECFVVENTIPGLLVSVLSSSDDSGLLGAEVMVEHISESYNETIISNEYGYALFPQGEDSMINGEYEIKVSLSGYQEVTQTVTVNNFTEHIIRLDAE